MALVGSKTPASMVQEYFIAKGITPSYELIHNGVGTHNPVFVYRVTAGYFVAQGQGYSKQQAKHEAAQALMEEVRLKETPELAVHVREVSRPQDNNIGYNAVGDLTEYCTKHNHPAAKYDLIGDEGPPHAKLFTVKCSVSQLITVGQTRSKKQAKQVAAHNMIKRLKSQAGEDFNAVVRPGAMRSPEKVPPKSPDIDSVSNEIAKQKIIDKYYEIKTAYGAQPSAALYNDHANAYLMLPHYSEALAKLMQDSISYDSETTPFDIVTKISEELSVGKFSVELERSDSDDEDSALKPVKFVVTLMTTPPVASIGVHAREWITSSVVMFIIKQLVENYGKYKKMVDGADWYLMPVANPDGYEFSHTTDRLWRKTRSKHNSSITRRLFGDCRGVDLNRNFDFRWGSNGSAADPCSADYSGPQPLSEPEAQAVADFVLDRRRELRMFITLHSYSQHWHVSSAYTAAHNEDKDDALLLAEEAIASLHRVEGTKYKLESKSASMQPTAGSSGDWAKSVAGIKYSYSVQLRDTGTHGFLLPATLIVPTARETFAAIKTMAKAISS